ncbi:MAG: YraN family protein [Alphaproteobacteria bacterium]
MTTPAGRRRIAEGLGRQAEIEAMAMLSAQGFERLACRFRCGREAGEIDLIVRRGSLVVFVEVKARASLEEALESVTPRQQRRIARAAEGFLQQRPEFAGLDCRFDVVVITPGRSPRHLPDAWRPEG